MIRFHHLMLTAAAAVLIAACEEQPATVPNAPPQENPSIGDQVREAARDTGEAIEDAARETGEAMEQAADETGEALAEATGAGVAGTWQAGAKTLELRLDGSFVYTDAADGTMNATGAWDYQDRALVFSGVVSEARFATRCETVFAEGRMSLSGPECGPLTGTAFEG